MRDLSVDHIVIYRASRLALTASAVSIYPETDFGLDEPAGARLLAVVSIRNALDLTFTMARRRRPDQGDIT